MNKEVVFGDLIEVLGAGKLPTSLRPLCSYSRMLAEELFPLIMTLPQFSPWVKSLAVTPMVAVYSGDEVPVIATNEALSRNECETLETATELVSSLMVAMCYALQHKRLSYEEVFAIVLDTVYTLNYKHYTTLSTVH